MSIVGLIMIYLQVVINDVVAWSVARRLELRDIRELRISDGICFSVDIKCSECSIKMRKGEKYEDGSLVAYCTGCEKITPLSREDFGKDYLSLDYFSELQKH